MYGDFNVGTNENTKKETGNAIFFPKHKEKAVQDDKRKGGGRKIYIDFYRQSPQINKILKFYLRRF